MCMKIPVCPEIAKKDADTKVSSGVAKARASTTGAMGNLMLADG